MKITKFIYALALTAAMAGVSSCNEDFSQPPVPTPEGGRVGTGEWNNPMTAYQALIGSVNDNLDGDPWVTGIIVGYVDVNVSNTASEASVVLYDQDAEKAENVTINTNIVIATSKEVFDTQKPEERWAHCATVQLPSGPVRSALNLKDHPDNLYKEVTIQGETGSKYCGVYGVRSASDYNWGPEGKEPVEVGPVEPGGAFYQDFDSSTDMNTYIARGWKNVMVTGGLSGWYIKDYNGSNYITTSAYLGNANGGPYENWLITPPVDMSKLDKKTLEFVTQAAYRAENSTLEVYVMTSDDPKKSTNSKLAATMAAAPESGYSSWVKSGVLDLSSFTGTIYIGWRYYSAAGGEGNSTTYCVDNVNVGDADTTAPVSPDSGDVYNALGEGDATTDWTFENVTVPAGVTAVWSWKEYNGKHYLNGSAYASSAQDSEAYAISPVVSLEGLTTAKVSFDHAAKFQTTLRELCGFVVREAGSETWTELTIPTWPSAGGWTFVNSGEIDLTPFCGKKIELGFRYGSSTAGADTWEIKNLKVVK